VVTGNAAPEEHELVIAKLLCGYPLRDTLDTHIDLEDDLLKNAEELLQEVVAQWDIMKGTSPAGLREAFLRRKGKLSWANDTHLVQVETATIDILLDQLPWTLNYIKFPW